MNNGLIQLYTGNGKGKTTASLGLALRAKGAGLKTLIIQFMKGQYTSEIKAIETINEISIEQYGSDEFYKTESSNYIEHRRLASEGLLRASDAISSGEYDIVILDEIIQALNFDLITFDELIELIEQKDETIELILTGRSAPTALYEYCDLVSEIHEVIHYANKGQKARKGIEF